jgi:hypothetical protein
MAGGITSVAGGVGDADGVTDGDAVGDGDADGEAVGAALELGLGLADALGDELGVGVGDGETTPEGDGVGVTDWGAANTWSTNTGPAATAIATSACITAVRGRFRFMIHTPTAPRPLPPGSLHVPLAPRPETSRRAKPATASGKEKGPQITGGLARARGGI